MFLNKQTSPTSNFLILYNTQNWSFNYNVKQYINTKISEDIEYELFYSSINSFDFFKMKNYNADTLFSTEFENKIYFNFNGRLYVYKKNENKIIKLPQTFQYPEEFWIKWENIFWWKKIRNLRDSINL